MAEYQQCLHFYCAELQGSCHLHSCHHCCQGEEGSPMTVSRHNRNGVKSLSVCLRGACKGNENEVWCPLPRSLGDLRMFTIARLTSSTPRSWRGLDSMTVTTCALGLSSGLRRHLNGVSHPSTDQAQRCLTSVTSVS